MKLDLKNRFRNLVSKPISDPILIFGFPKSGTSAITALLAQRTNKTVTLDTKYLWEPFISKIKTGDINLSKHINKYSYPFSKEIIKEPNMVFIIDKLLTFYPNPKVLIIKRDKLTNIKSILDRLQIPGDLEINPKKENINKNWINFILKDDLHYIDVLNNHYLKAEKNLDLLKCLNPVYINYEDFKYNKKAEIDRIANELSLEPKFEIDHLLDVQYQPKGKNNKDVKSFFGNNLKKLI